MAGIRKREAVTLVTLQATSFSRMSAFLCCAKAVASSGRRRWNHNLRVREGGGSPSSATGFEKKQWLPESMVTARNYACFLEAGLEERLPIARRRPSQSAATVMNARVGREEVSSQ